MREPARWTLESVRQLPAATTTLICSRAVGAKISTIIHLPAICSTFDVPDTATTLLVAGGGRLIDECKRLRRDRHPSARLIVIPTLWGSGSEQTRIALWMDGDHKRVEVSDDLMPDGVCYLPELSATIPHNLALSGCGDAWSHAYEALLSPLSSHELRTKLARLITRMLQVGLGADPAWFELSGSAAHLQQQAGVGLVHGIAHSLQGPLRQRQTALGHAALCSLFLWPVHRFNQSRGDKCATRCQRYGLDPQQMASTFRELHSSELYNAVVPCLVEEWSQIVRDPTTRTNSTLVRRRDLDFFTGLT